jgi:hypothetical protein
MRSEGRAGESTRPRNFDRPHSLSGQQEHVGTRRLTGSRLHPDAEPNKLPLCCSRATPTKPAPPPVTGRAVYTQNDIDFIAAHVVRRSIAFPDSLTPDVPHCCAGRRIGHVHARLVRWPISRPKVLDEESKEAHVAVDPWSMWRLPGGVPTAVPSGRFLPEVGLPHVAISQADAGYRQGLRRTSLTFTFNDLQPSNSSISR